MHRDDADLTDFETGGHGDFGFVRVGVGVVERHVVSQQIPLVDGLQVAGAVGRGQRARQKHRDGRGHRARKTKRSLTEDKVKKKSEGTAPHTTGREHVSRRTDRAAAAAARRRRRPTRRRVPRSPPPQRRPSPAGTGPAVTYLGNGDINGRKKKNRNPGSKF